MLQEFEVKPTRYTNISGVLDRKMWIVGGERMKALNISGNEKILIIAPHPDDECIGPGGVLLSYPHLCEVIVLTDGRQGQGDYPPEKIKEIRRTEFIREMDWLGISKFRMLGIEDGTLLGHTDCLSELDLSEYDVIFVTGIQDEHPDHKAAHISLLERLRKQLPKKVPLCFAYEVHTPLQQPTHFLDITDKIHDKIDLIRFHKSQLKELPYDELVNQCASYRATLLRMRGKKVEVFEKISVDNNTSAVISETGMLLQKERINGWTLKRWVYRLLDGVKLADEVKKENINEVYIYGYGDLGKLALKELLSEGISVKAVIDRRAGQFGNEETDIITVDRTDTKIPVIVTAIYEFDEIEKTLIEIGVERIFSLRRLLERA